MEHLPDAGVPILTASTEMDAVIESVAAGATGYFQKYSPLPEELVEAVLDVAEDRIGMSEQPLKEAFAMIRTEHWFALRGDSDELTALERETLTLFASGRSYTQVSEVRGSSNVTVRNTIHRIQDKLGVRTKQEFVIWAVRNGRWTTW